MLWKQYIILLMTRPSETYLACENMGWLLTLILASGTPLYVWPLESLTIFWTDSLVMNLWLLNFFIVFHFGKGWPVFWRPHWPNETKNDFRLSQKMAMEGDKWVSLEREFKSFGPMIKRAPCQVVTCLISKGRAHKVGPQKIPAAVRQVCKEAGCCLSYSLIDVWMILYFHNVCLHISLNLSWFLAWKPR